MSLLGTVLNLFNFGSGSDDNRWHPPMSSDVTKLGDFGTKESEMGDQDGDHPLPAIESTLSDETFGTIETYATTYNEVEDVHIRW